MLSKFLSCALVVVSLVFAAAPPSVADAQNRRVQQLLDEAQTLRRSGRDADAVVILEQAVAIERTPRAVSQFGLAHHALGHFARARLLLIEALAHQRDTWIASRRPALETALRDCEAHVGRVFVEGAQPGDEILCDGTPCGIAPLSEPIVVDAHELRVAVVRSGGPVSEGVISVPPAGEVTFAVVAPVSAPQTEQAANVAVGDVTASPDSATPLPANPSATSAPNPLTPWAWAAIGTGAAGLGAGVVLHVLREGDAGEYRDLSCTTSVANSERCTTLYDRRTPLTAGAIAGYALGGALVATGVVLLLLPASSEQDGSAASVMCAPALGTTNGIFCSGAF